MGLLDIFRKKSSSSTSDKSLEDFSTLDLSALLDKSVFYKRHEHADKFNSIEYECSLENLVLKTFDKIRIRLGWEEKELKQDAKSAIITTFLRKDRKMTMQQTAYVVNTVAKICKVHDDNWTNADEMRINSGVWRGRNFMVGNCMVTIELDENDGITLCIVGFKDFLAG